MAKKPRPRLVPRIGPKTNVRPGGPHESHRRPSRRDVKIALKLQGDFPFPGPTRFAGCRFAGIVNDGAAVAVDRSFTLRA